MANVDTTTKEDKPKKRFEMVFGPAFLAIVFQTLAALAAFSYGYGRISQNQDDQKLKLEEVIRQVDRNTNHVNIVIDKQVDRTNGINDRLIAVETTVKSFQDTLRIIIDKLDKFKVTETKQN